MYLAIANRKYSLSIACEIVHVFPDLNHTKNSVCPLKNCMIQKFQAQGLLGLCLDSELFIYSHYRPHNIFPVEFCL